MTCPRCGFKPAKPKRQGKRRGNMARPRKLKTLAAAKPKEPPFTKRLAAKITNRYTGRRYHVWEYKHYWRIFEVRKDGQPRFSTVGVVIVKSTGERSQNAFAMPNEKEKPTHGQV